MEYLRFLIGHRSTNVLAAHIIRRKGTLFNRAVSELSAKSRWCLTGTPIQNKFEDIGALFAFIRARPFHNIGMFRKLIANPFNESGKRRAIAVRRLVTLLDSLCIRRTKERLHLPQAEDLRKELTFSPAEQQQYDKTVRDMSRCLKQQVGNSKSMNDFGLFQINLQLRILCNHGTHQQPFAWKRNAWLENMRDMREFALTSMVATGEVVCSYCKETMPITSARNIYRMYGEQCRHAICDLCSVASLDEDAEDGDFEIQCPICAQTELLRDVKSRPAAKRVLDEHYFQPNGYSTKMACLVADLLENISDKKRHVSYVFSSKHKELTVASIVFSCWTKTLELISRYLKDAGIPFERIDGGISLRERENILEAFAKRHDLPVLIMTTGTGAYGLNLTAASRIFIIEPQWNPAVENQAISRAIRLGQADSVQVTRYVTKNTVEQVSGLILFGERSLKVVGHALSTEPKDHDCRNT
jgi:SWI/SNF-related matrix-associated actin-dependent regulator of chromatin subfamily A3